MEPIKIQVEINISESAQNFLSNLFDFATAKSAPEKVTTKKSVTKKTQAEKSAEEKNEAEEAKKVETEEAPVTLEILRTLLSEKVSNHRDEIKAKLTELNSPSLTRLPESAYQEMYNFLMSL